MELGSDSRTGGMSGGGFPLCCPLDPKFGGDDELLAFGAFAQRFRCASGFPEQADDTLMLFSRKQPSNAVAFMGSASTNMS